ncbi:hypothetical protein ABZW30_13940 [Kitasatospora sp. NPDC004669]|uniref:hypothetical protein n=1 Tax=Kitasatospora sp. NPDC004669 TaxID=3154555 RepID=UPI0033AD4A3F
MNHLLLRTSAIGFGLAMGLATVPSTAAFAAPTTSVACGDTAALIAAVNALNGPGGTIELAANCTYAFSTQNDSTGAALPPITGKITITGHDSALVRSTDIPSNLFRILQVTSTGDLTLHGVEVTGGASGIGGGIFNSGKLTLDKSAVTHNEASGGGGGIFSNSGTVTIRRSSVSDNVSGDEGGGIDSIGPAALTVTGSRIESNQAVTDGGGIESQGPLSVENSVFAHNSARDGSGGGLFYLGLPKATLKDTDFIDNFAGVNGGGINNEPKDRPIEITGGEIRDNTAGRDGGGLNNAGIATLTKVKVKANSSGRDGGGINNQTVTGESAVATLTLDHSTVTENTAARDGGGINNQTGSTVTLNDSRVIRNTPNNCTPLNSIAGCQN